MLISNEWKIQSIWHFIRKWIVLELFRLSTLEYNFYRQNFWREGTRFSDILNYQQFKSPFSPSPPSLSLSETNLNKRRRDSKLKYMEYRKDLSWLWQIVGKFWGLCLAPFSSSYPIHSFIILFAEATRELKNDRKKTRIPLDSNLILGAYGYSVVIMFFWNSKK